MGFGMQFNKELFSFERQLPHFCPGKCVDFGKILKDQHSHVSYSQVQRHTLRVLSSQNSNEECTQNEINDQCTQLPFYGQRANKQWQNFLYFGGMHFDAIELAATSSFQEIEVRFSWRLAPKQNVIE